VPCREHLARVRERQADFDRLGAVVAAVTFEPPARAATFATREGWPYPVLSDPGRRAYAAFGLQRGRARQLWNWRSLMAYARGLGRGRLPRPARADIDQLGGDIVLDPAGRVAFLHRSVEPADRPAVADLVAAARRAADAPTGS